jgi:hypothetical protein
MPTTGEPLTFNLEVGERVHNSVQRIAKLRSAAVLAIATIGWGLSNFSAAALQQAVDTSDLRPLSNDNREMIESACGVDRRFHGPAAYRDCVGKQLAALRQGASPPDLSSLSGSDREMIESACGVDRRFHGPAAYRDCVGKQLAALRQGASPPDLSSLSGSDREMIESACGVDRRFHGPAAYRECVSRQLTALRQIPSLPDLSSLSASDREMIESACGVDRRFHGPAAYYACLRTQLLSLSRDNPTSRVVTSQDNLASPTPEHIPTGASPPEPAILESGVPASEKEMLSRIGATTSGPMAPRI